MFVCVCVCVCVLRGECRETSFNVVGFIKTDVPSESSVSCVIQVRIFILLRCVIQDYEKCKLHLIRQNHFDPSTVIVFCSMSA